MGWPFQGYDGMGGHRTAKAYLDAQFTYEREATDDAPAFGYRVLASSCLRNKVWYAAVQRYDENGDGEIFAAVCLVRWNPRAKDGLIFGYKDMDEAMGPCETDCPQRILDLLGPTQHPYALNWRRRCHRQRMLENRELADGALIRFPSAIKFTDGSKHREFRVHRTGRSHYLVPEGENGRYRISSLKSRLFEIVPERQVHATVF